VNIVTLLLLVDDLRGDSPSILFSFI